MQARLLQQPASVSITNLRRTLAASLLVLAQAAMADEIGITPYERQLNLRDTGIVTLRFEVENRSGQTRQLQERIILPAGWQLITNTAPFLLASGTRDVRLVHVSLPKGTNAGAYAIDYSVMALDNGGVTGNQVVTVQLEAQAGLKISTQQAPGSLLEGESFLVDFVVTNTGNQQQDYSLEAYDSERFIQSVEPRKLSLPVGGSGIVRVQGKVSGKISETTQYGLTLQARGGGSKSEQTVNIPLIARTPRGLGKYQKLPGKVKTVYTQETQNNNGKSLNSRAFQLEYYARGSIDAAGEHQVEIKLRNGKNQGSTGIADQLEEYYVAYHHDAVSVKTGHQSFATNHLTGNSFSGIGASTVYRPRDKDGKSPLSIQAFYGKSRPLEDVEERAVFAALNYDWKNYQFSVSALQHESGKSEKTTIMAAGVAWRGEHVSLRGEVASDGKAQAYSVDASGQWDKLGLNISATRAGTGFSGSVTDSLQLYSNLNYQLSNDSNISFRLRKTRDNLEQDNSREIRADNEQEIRFSQKLGAARQAELSVGLRRRNERDLRPQATTDREIRSAQLEYRQYFDTVDVRLAAGAGKRQEAGEDDASGSSQELSLNWRPRHDLNLGGSYALNQNLDSAGKSVSAGLNGRFDLNQHANISGYAQYITNEADNSHARSFELQYNHDFKSLGQIGVRARRIDNLASDGNRSNDKLLQLEYTLPLDIPLRKRDNIGSLQGRVTFPDNKPARDVVLQLDGEYAVTDANGEFLYPDRVAKDYQLSIDSTRPNTEGLLLDGDSPFNSVSIAAGSTSNTSFTLRQGSHLKGRLARFVPDTASLVLNDDNSRDHLKEDSGLGMVLLELRPVGERGNRITHRRSTLFDGSFSFLGIPPGQWELTVVDVDKIPDNFRLEQNRFTLDLVPGDNQDIMIRALPTAQTIKKTGPQQGFHVSG